MTSNNNPDTEWGQAVMPEGPRRKRDSREQEEEEEETVEVAVVGGGLAGLATAIGLHRAGIPVKVYERAPKLRSNSQGILAVQPNGMKALERIHPNLPEMIVESGCERKQLVFTKINGTNSVDGSVTVEETVREIGQESMKKYGRYKVGLTWHKMQQLLASLLPPELVVTNRSLISFEEEDNENKNVLLHFEDCNSSSNDNDNDDDQKKKKRFFVVRAKAVLACDGVFSAARRQMFPSEDDPPIYFGQLNWATVIDSHKLPPNVHPPNAVHYFMYDGGEAAAAAQFGEGKEEEQQLSTTTTTTATISSRWMSMLNDGGGGETFWQFRVVDPDMALSLSASKGRGGLGLEGVKKALLPVAKPCDLVYKAIECIPENQIFERSIVGRLPASTWLSPGGRVALVGDSAHGMHPNIAQGFNNAAESSCAVVQAMVEEYQRCNNTTTNNSSSTQGEDVVDWCAALKAFEQKRKPKADIVQRWANMMGCYQATGQTVVSNDVMTSVIDWIIGGDPAKYPSKETLEVIFSFDPLSQRGVSKIT